MVRVSIDNPVTKSGSGPVRSAPNASAMAARLQGAMSLMRWLQGAIYSDEHRRYVRIDACVIYSYKKVLRRDARL